MRNAEDTASCKDFTTSWISGFHLLSHTLLGAMDSRSVVSKLCHHQSHEKLLNSRSLHAFDFSEHVVGPNINVRHTPVFIHRHTF